MPPDTLGLILGVFLAFASGVVIGGLWAAITTHKSG